MCFKAFHGNIKKGMPFADSNYEKEHSADHNPYSISDEIDLIYHLKDVLDELFIVRHFFSNQEEVVKSYHRELSQHKTPDVPTENSELCRHLQGFIDVTKRLEEIPNRVLGNVRKSE
jgi:hypothetical protein